jgi:hypothetical protein
MDPKLQAGVELTLEKIAVEQSPANSPLGRALRQKFAEEQNVVKQIKKSEGYSPSSASSPGMEDKNDGYGTSDEKLDDDPSKNSSAATTGKVNQAVGEQNITTEARGMPDLSIDQHKVASAGSIRAAAMSKILHRYMQG